MKELFNKLNFDENINITIDEIEEKIKIILEKVFKEKEKREVIRYYNRITFSCPYCGDSLKSKYKRRGNIYLNNYYFKCFNCGENKNLLKFLNDFLELDFDEKFKYHIFIKNKNNLFFSGVNLSEVDLLNNKIILEASFDKKFLIDKLKLKEIKYNKSKYSAYRYLSKRKIPHSLGLEFIEKNFLTNSREDEIYILNLNKDDRIVSFTIRFLNNNNIKYKLFSNYKLHKIFNLTPPFEENSIENRICNIYNIFKVNFKDFITITEGQFDCIFLVNAIAIQGLNKNLPIFIEKKRFLFDNDEIGRKKSLELLRQGEYVFLWKKFLKHFKAENLNIKDINDFRMKVNNNHLSKLKTNTRVIFYFKTFNQFFSNNLLDAIFI